MSDNLMKISSQGVRDYKIKKDDNINDDIGDVYDQKPSHQPAHFDTNKATVSKASVRAKKRSVRRRKSIDVENSKHVPTALDLTLKASKLLITFFVISTIILNLLKEILITSSRT